MKRKSSFGGFWAFFLLFILFGGGSWIMPVVFGCAMVFFLVKGIKAATDSSSSSSSSTGYQYGHATRTRNRRTRSDRELAEINSYLKRYFSNKRLLEMNDNIDLVLRGASYSGTSSLDVYRNGRRINSLDGFSRNYEDLYETMMDTLSSMAKKDAASHPGTIVDAEVVTPQEKAEPAEQPQPKQPEEEKVHGARYFIDAINSLNNDIPDEEISNGLYQSSQLLTEISKYEEKFPDSKNKLEKLYTYYLPILIRILQQYSNLQYAKSDPSYEETQSNLKRTLKLVNDAMSKIISGLTDNDFINLSADMSTLEAVLKKDGLTGSDPLSMPSGSSKEEGK
ncbi:MAG: hypothetical protein LKF79_08055 [Solobacterium sp.]|jgi:hypothetical protein|nr:hypothetical protein [Solobacterium sp.]MCH4223149.1 hypothetical protein [Solobacterium sp.]MCH4266580.1 hypothetical protein [Solobacterium sp.]